MNLARLKKEKRKKVLSLSAGGPGSGIQGLYVEVEESSWSIISHTFIPYPELIHNQIRALAEEEEGAFTPAHVAALDHRIAQLFSECAATIRATSPNAQKRPHIAVVNKLPFWRTLEQAGPIPAGWVFEVGSAAPLASQLRVPVLTDCALTGALTSSGADIPLQAGIARIAARTGGSIAFVNIGLISRALGIDANAGRVLFDSDTGPGTCLLNRAARACGCPGGFDRDGAFAQTGAINRECLNALCEQEWFLLPAPKRATIGRLAQLDNHPGLQGIGPADTMATLTALTARTIFEFVKREYREFVSLPALWISGGGAHNHTLIEYLKAFFGPVPVKTVEEIGIPVEGMIPLALALTAASHLEGRPLSLGGSGPQRLGTWVWM